MPKKPKKDDPSTKVEERWVEWSDLENGVNLKAGHPVILFLGGVAGQPGSTTTSAPSDSTTAAPAPSASTTQAPPEDTTDAPSASTTANPSASTTAAPPATTSAAPETSTTSAPTPVTTSAAPSTTTMAAPASTTTAAPASTTTAAPASTTTAAPASTTTAAPASTTTAAPASTTTAAPASTTTAAPASTTTAAPASTTTAAPASTTTAAPASTTTAAPASTTTAAPASTTTAAPASTTTHAPSTTTTANKQTRKTSFPAEHFETAKSFPLPANGQAIATFRKIAALANQDPKWQLLILGHTDTQGTDSYNLTLSTERATSIQQYLLNDNNSWYAWYSNADPQKQWGIREDQYMLGALPYPSTANPSPTPYFNSAVTGITNADYTAALQKFQGDVGEPATGTANQSTRLKLILAYMQAEGTSVPAATTIELQGCGFRNQAVSPPTAAGVNNATNRRVEVYAFPGAIAPDASAWAGDNAGTYAAWQATVAGDFDDA